MLTLGDDLKNILTLLEKAGTRSLATNVRLCVRVDCDAMLRAMSIQVSQRVESYSRPTSLKRPIQ